MARKFLNRKKIDSLGIKPEINLKDGLTKTYKNYIKTI